MTTTHRLETAEASIAYDLHGPLPTADGLPPLFMIGQPMDARGFATLASHFPDRTVVTYDPRGLGRSTRNDGRADNTPTLQAEDMHAVIEALGRLGVGEHRDEGRLVRHQGGHVAGVGRHERERSHGTPAAGEHLNGPGAECLDDGVNVVCLDRGRIVDPAVSASAAAEAARVIGDHGAVGEVRGQRAKAAGGHGLTDHEQRWTSVGGGQRAVNVIGDVGPGRFKCVCGGHGVSDHSRGEKSSLRQRPPPQMSTPPLERHEQRGANRTQSAL